MGRWHKNGKNKQQRYNSYAVECISQLRSGSLVLEIYISHNQRFASARTASTLAFQ